MKHVFAGGCNLHPWQLGPALRTSGKLAQSFEVDCKQYQPVTAFVPIPPVFVSFTLVEGLSKPFSTLPAAHA